MCSHYLRSHFVLKSLLNKGRIEFLVMEDPLKKDTKILIWDMVCSHIIF